VWQYLAAEQIPLPELYYAHQRDCFERDGVIYAASDFMRLKPSEVITRRQVRFRTIGDMSCTGAVESEAADIEAVIAEIAASRFAERGARADDLRTETHMEDRKKLGYF
jgi:sulfate adenylyltransferase subunit 2